MDDYHPCFNSTASAAGFSHDDADDKTDERNMFHDCKDATTFATTQSNAWEETSAASS